MRFQLKKKKKKKVMGASETHSQVRQKGRNCKISVRAYLADEEEKEEAGRR